jgi:hypothetical protein
VIAWSAARRAGASVEPMDLAFGEGPAERSEPEGGSVVVGVIAPPGASAQLARALATDIVEDLADRLPGTSWQVEVRTDPLVVPPVDDHDLVDAVRARMLEEGWDLAVFLTDLPLAVRGRPVVAHASPLHGVAIVSVPALGAVGVRRRVRETSFQLLRTLLAAQSGEDTAAWGRRRRGLQARVRRLGVERGDPGSEVGAVRFTSRVLGGNLRLLIGMVRTNQPWRLAAKLSRALTAAAAAGAFALVTSDIWRLADAFGWARLLFVTTGSVVATCLTLIVGADLWERSARRGARQQIVLFNLATTVTVLLGVLWLFAALLVLAFISAKVVVVPSLLTSVVGHRSGTGDLLEVAWLAASIAMVGGALGAGLESDEAVRAAAYAHREAEPSD